MADKLDLDGLERDCEKGGWVAFPVETTRALIARIRSLEAAPQPAAAPDGLTLVKTETVEWLLGERGAFECPPEQYFRGKPAPFFWRKQLREAEVAFPERMPLAGEIFGVARAFANGWNACLDTLIGPPCALSNIGETK